MTKAIPKFNFTINGVQYIKDKEYDFVKTTFGYTIKGDNGEINFTNYDASQLFKRRIHIEK